MNAALAVTLGYLLGSIPFAFLLSRQRGVDLRRVGSGNVGASNVLRTTGPGAAVLAVLLDGVKGAAAVLLAQLLSAGVAAPVAAGVASVVGHVSPVWLRFRGGKGVATAAGAFAVLAPGACAVAVGTFVAVVLATRFVSVGSLAAAVTLTAVTATGEAPMAVTIGAAVSTMLIIHRHRANLARLIGGTEHRLGQRVANETIR
jgi:glycerol-3-phosphate acyltransferase PlsY